MRVSSLIEFVGLIGIILLHGNPASALNPSSDVSQYAHTAWLLRNAAFNGYPRSIVQTPDGYLWLGTEFGLLRFDGVRFVPWRAPAGQELPSPSIAKLFVSRDGSLWIGTFKGLARLNRGVLMVYAELNARLVATAAEDPDGTIWVGARPAIGDANLCGIKADKVECFAQDGSLGRFISELFVDSAGALWVGSATGLWKWSRTGPISYPLKENRPEIRTLVETAGQGLLLAWTRGVKQILSDVVTDYPLPPTTSLLRPTTMLRDRHGALWIGTQDQGIYHVRNGKVDHFSRTDGLSGDSVSTGGLFEDREGNIWVGTLNGLDRFRDFAVTTLSAKQGVPGTVFAISSDSESNVWIGTPMGLHQWKNGEVTIHRLPGGQSGDGVGSLFESRDGRLWVSSQNGLAVLQSGHLTRATPSHIGFVQAMAQDNSDDIWIAEQDQGLLRLRGTSVTGTTPWSTFGGRTVRAMSADPADGGLWLGFFQGGLAHFKDGAVVSSYTTKDGLGDGSVTSLLVDRDGTVWATTQTGLSRVSHSKIVTLTRASGLPCNNINWAIRDATDSMWLYTECGLIRIAAAELSAWVQDPGRHVTFSLYGPADGNAIHADAGNYTPKVSRAADGKLWFISFEGVGVIDPAHIPFNSLAPPVHVEQVTADDATYDTTSALRLHAQVRDLRIDYTALSLTLPERVTFRYKLEGRDQDWVDAGTRRQAFYSDLGPREYRFRVIASNNDGVWNEEGAVIALTIPPAWFQTAWFRGSLVLLTLSGLWGLAQLRWRRLEMQLKRGFQERLDERTRIAQDLHDTLLQGMLAVSMQLGVLKDEITDHTAHGKLSGILGRLGQVIDEGRLTLHGLRSHATDDTLEHALRRDAEDFRGEQSVDIRIATEGARQPLNPFIGDDVYRITREAVVNALRHSRPTRLDITIQYSRQGLRITVADDGCGIDPEILQQDRHGHFGMRGMRERAERIGATIRFWSRSNAGTEVELVVPESAFQRTVAGSKAAWWRRVS